MAYVLVLLIGFCGGLIAHDKLQPLPPIQIEIQMESSPKGQSCPDGGQHSEEEADSTTV